MKTNRILSVLFYALLGSFIAGLVGGFMPLFALVGAVLGQGLSYFRIAENVLAINLPPTIKEAREQRAKLETDLKSWHEKVKKDKKELTDEEWQKFDQMIDDSRALRTHIERLEKIEASEKELAEKEYQEKHVEVEKKDTKEEERKAFERFIRFGINDISQEEREIVSKLQSRAQSTTTTAGGYLIPEGFSNMIEKAMLPYLAGINEFTVINTASGNDIQWPTVNDTSNEGEQIDENPSDAVSEQDVTFGQKTLKAYMFTSKMVKVSLQLLQDSAFNIEQLLADLLGERLGRVLNDKFTNGLDTTTIQGILVGATKGVSAASTALTRNNIVDLMYSVNSDYRSRGIFMISDAAEKAIRKLAFGTSDDRPLWQAGSIAGGLPDTIEGKRYVVNNKMSGPSLNAKSVLFGDLKKYIVRRVTGTTLFVFREKYMDKLQVAFMAYARYDGRLLDAGTNPVKYIQHSAT